MTKTDQTELAQPASPADDIDMVLVDRLRVLLADIGGNKHDNADLVILACLDEGISSGAVIRRTGVALGIDGKHMSIRMKVGVENGWWCRAAEGKYSPAPASQAA